CGNSPALGLDLEPAAGAGLPSPCLLPWGLGPGYLPWVLFSAKGCRVSASATSYAPIATRPSFTPPPTEPSFIVSRRRRIGRGWHAPRVHSPPPAAAQPCCWS